MDDESIKRTIGIVDYPNDYIESCFYSWYRAGHPDLSSSSSRIIKYLPNSPDGRTPAASTVRKWANKYGWIERADALDGQLSQKLDREAIQERARKIKELAEAGAKMKDKGLEYFEKEDNPFKDNPSAAVRAVTSGAEMVFKYAGHADALLAISQMSDKQLDKEMMRLLGKNENEESNTIDVIPTDVDSEDSPSDGDTADNND